MRYCLFLYYSISLSNQTICFDFGWYPAYAVMVIQSRRMAASCRGREARCTLLHWCKRRTRHGASISTTQIRWCHCHHNKHRHVMIGLKSEQQQQQQQQ